jgi:arabinose-5-phosphate isomerase
MHTGEAVPRVRGDATLEDTILEMTKKRFGMTTVIDGDGRLTGVVTDGDLRRLHLRTQSIAGVRAADVASSTPKTIAPDELAAKALEVMEAWAITSLVVPDADGRPSASFTCTISSERRSSSRRRPLRI